MKNYRLTITKVEPNPEFAKQMEELEKTRHNYGRSMMDMSDPRERPQREITTDVLIVEVTQEQFEKIRLEVLKNF